MTPDIDNLYAILRQWAAEGAPHTYADLSNAYSQRTGEWFEPHGSWDAPLGVLNNRLAKVGAPAISALVILKTEMEPGGKFWGCAPNVPPRPKSAADRAAEWTRILKDVFAYRWPQGLP